MSAPTILNLLTTVVSFLSNTPLIGGNENEMVAPGTPSVYGANRAGDDDETKFAQFEGDGAAVDFDMPAALDDIPVAVAITDALRLECVVMIVGNSNLKTPIQRLNDAAAPAAGQWSRTDADTIKLGTAPAAGQLGEVWIAETVTLLTGGALVAGREYNTPVFDFMTASSLTNIRGLTR